MMKKEKMPEFLRKEYSYNRKRKFLEGLSMFVCGAACSMLFILVMTLFMMGVI